jgi:hypothetical protein
MKHYGGLKDWEFQSEIPVVQSRYSLLMVPTAEFTYAIKKSEEFPIDISRILAMGK